MGFSDNPTKALLQYKEHITECISHLEVYLERVETFGLSETNTSGLQEAQRSKKRGTSASYYARELYLGDRIQSEVGNISNNSGQVLIGKFNKVVANLDSSDQTQLAEALKVLEEAVMASSYLNEDEKQDHVDVITEIGERAVEPTPNKAKLKRLCAGLMTTLKVIPDVANAVTAVLPVLTQLHL